MGRTRYIVHSLRGWLFCASLILAGACGDSGTEPVTEGISAKVNGADWKAEAFSSILTDSSFSFTATNVNKVPVERISLSLKLTSTGTYIVGGKNGAHGEWGSGTTDYSTIDSMNTVQGEVKVTTFNDKEASGTFNFTPRRDGNPESDFVTVNEGKFTILK